MTFEYSREAFIAVLLVSSAIGAAAVAADPATVSDPARQAQSRTRMEACRPDAQRLCADAETGGGRKMACLRMHIAELTPACRDALPSAPARKSGSTTDDGVAK